MKCNICGRNYVALGVHLRHKHKVSPAEYKEEFGMLMATPLVDPWLSERLSSSVNERLKDPVYKNEVSERCRENASKNVGGPGTYMTKAGRESIARSDGIRNDAYLKRQSEVVSTVLAEKGTMLDVRRQTGSGPTAAKKMAKMAGVQYSVESAKIIRDARAAATTRKKCLERVEKVKPYLSTTKSAAEMCRLCGISLRTYKNWVSAGFIDRHPNGRGLTTPISAPQSPQQSRGNTHQATA